MLAMFVLAAMNQTSTNAVEKGKFKGNLMHDFELACEKKNWKDAAEIQKRLIKLGYSEFNEVLDSEYFRYAEVLNKAGNYKEEINVLELLILKCGTAIDPTYVWQLAEAYSAIGNPERASIAWQNAFLKSCRNYERTNNEISSSMIILIAPPKEKYSSEMENDPFFKLSWDRKVVPIDDVNSIELYKKKGFVEISNDTRQLIKKVEESRMLNLGLMYGKWLNEQDITANSKQISSDPNTSLRQLVE